MNKLLIMKTIKNNTKEPEKDIVSFNQALELCSIGFDEPTFCMYEIENKQLCLCYLDEDGLYIPQKDFHAPTKSQVFRWFRDKFNLKQFVGWRPNVKKFDSHIVDMTLNGIEYAKSRGFKEFNSDLLFDDYDKAESHLIDLMIERAKQQ